jgi:hypothetical protein
MPSKGQCQGQASELWKPTSGASSAVMPADSLQNHAAADQVA